MSSNEMLTAFVESRADRARAKKAPVVKAPLAEAPKTSINEESSVPSEFIPPPINLEEESSTSSDSSTDEDETTLFVPPFSDFSSSTSEFSPKSSDTSLSSDEIPDIFESIPLPTRTPLTQERKRGLSLSGGGSRGVIELTILAEIEQRTHKPIAYLFPVIAGSSTGSIIAAGLARGISAKTLLKQYLELVPKVFGRNAIVKFFNPRAMYDPKILEDFLEEIFGNHKMTDVLEGVDLLIPYFDHLNVESRLISTRQARINSKDNMRLVDAIMASTAAPHYFPPYQIDEDQSGQDAAVGGLINPALETLIEMYAHWGKDQMKKAFLLSLVCGTPAEPQYLSDKQYRKLCFLKVPFVIIDSLLTSTGKNASREAEQFITHLIGGENFEEINPPMPDNLLELDISDRAALDKLVRITQQHLEDHPELLDQIEAAIAGSSIDFALTKLNGTKKSTPL